MHSSVLQNDKYIKFAHEHTVDVLSLGRLDEAIKKKDSKAGTYETTDENGQKVERLVEWPSLTVAEVEALRRSPAGRYNDTGKIPFTCVVDPYTGKELQRWSGGVSAGTIMDAVIEHERALRKEHGPGLSRSTMEKYGALESEVRKTLAEHGVARAMRAYKHVERFAEKEGGEIAKRSEALLAELTDSAEKQLEEAKRLIDSGKERDGKRILIAIRSAFRGRDLADRAQKMMDEANAR